MCVCVCKLVHINNTYIVQEYILRFFYVRILSVHKFVCLGTCLGTCLRVCVCVCVFGSC